MALGNNGYKNFTTLEQYYTDNGAATGNYKSNNPGDPDYIASVYDPSACPLPVITYYSVAKSGVFTRTNCGEGYTGGSSTYYLNANTYSSTTDQATADTAAQNDVDTWGQSWVNGYNLGGAGSATAGSCTYNGPTVYALYVRLGYDVGSICSQGVTTVYSNWSSVVQGALLFYDAALTSGVEGYSYVVDTSTYGTPIYEIDWVGQVGLSTGGSCG